MGQMDYIPTFDLVHLSIIGISILISVVAIGFACFLPKKQPTTVFVINLLVSDLIQLISVILMKVGHLILFVPFFIGFMASVGFMVWISLDRYLFIAKPTWYESRRKKVYTVLVCVAVWFLAALYFALFFVAFLFSSFKTGFLIFGVSLLLPLPFFFFFVVRTVDALSEAHSVPADEKRGIVSIVVAILLIYTLLFLPVIILCLMLHYTNRIDLLFKISSITVCISPIADSILYVFLRKGLADKLLVSLCCCKMSNNQQTVAMDTVDETVRVQLNTETSADA